MQTKIEEIGPCKKKLSIEVPPEDLKEELESEFEKIRESAVIPGFRKGKVPRILLEKRYKSQIEEDVKQSIISNSFQKALEDNDLKVLGIPEFGEIDFDFEKPLNFDITLEVKPEFEINDYKGLEITKKNDTVDDKMINEELKRISLQSATLAPVKDGTIEKGDSIICDYNLECDGKEIFKDEDLEINVSSQLVGNISVSNLEESLIGAKSDKEVAIDIKLRDNFQIEEFRGKDANLKILIKDIKRPVPTKIDEEFAKSLKFDSLEDLRDRIEMQMEIQLKGASRQDAFNQIADKLFEKASFDMPEGVIKSMAGEKVEKYKTALLNRGEPLDKVEEMAVNVKDESEDAVGREFKLSLILEYIATKERIYVTDNEVDARIAEYARNYNISVEKMQRYIDKMENLKSMRHQMREDKTLDFLLKEAKIVDGEKPASTDAGEKKAEPAKAKKTTKKSTAKTDDDKK